MRYGHLNELMRAVSRFAIVGVVGGMAAACSSDTMRLSENPFSDPFGSSQPNEPRRTGSVDHAPAAIKPMPRSTVSSAPLSAPGAAPMQVASAPVSVPSSGVSGLNPSAHSTPAMAPRQAALPARPAMVAAAAAPVRAAPAPTHVAQGQVVTHYRLVEGKKPLAQTARAEPAPVHIRPGRPVAQPVHEARVEEAAKPAHPRPGRAAMMAKAEPAKVVEKPAAKLAKVEPAPAAPKKIAAVELVKPAKPIAAPVLVAQAPKPAKAPEPVKVASLAPAKVVQPEPAKSAPAAREPEATGALSPAPAASASVGTTAEFRWPARGRVITGFGGGGSNEGINIAVPEGTPVKAAESGTIAYAGSEVKGYGNLVLIRHDNGFVSAYAHNGDIEVKRGQRVTRGQEIAKSGQTGNVTSPQLHFELRKGSTPIDPMPHLASN